MAALAATIVMLGPRRRMATSQTTRADAALAVRVASAPVVAAASARVGRVAAMVLIHGVDRVGLIRGVPDVVAPAVLVALAAGVPVVPALVRGLDPAVAMIGRVQATSPRRATVANRAMGDVVLIRVAEVGRVALIHAVMARVPDVVLAVQDVVLAGLRTLVAVGVVVRVDGG
jgi:hypothetical protein